MEPEDTARRTARQRDLSTPLEASDEAVVIRQEEEIGGVRKRWRGLGFVRARKHVETMRVDEVIPRLVEDAKLDRVPANEDDSGKIETLADGSISIPVYEEELVVTKRVVLRERIVLRKQVVSEDQRIRTELRKERVEIDADDEVRDLVDGD